MKKILFAFILLTIFNNKIHAKDEEQNKNNNGLKTKDYSGKEIGNPTDSNAISNDQSVDQKTIDEAMKQLKIYQERRQQEQKIIEEINNED